MTHTKTPAPAPVRAPGRGGSASLPGARSMTEQQAAWVRADAWPTWMKAMDDDYPGRGCFLLRTCHCELGVCVNCSPDEPRHDLCLTRQHDGRALGWDMAVYAAACCGAVNHARRVAKVTIAGRSCRWTCPCGCWREPLPEIEPKVIEPEPKPVTRVVRPARAVPALDGQGDLFEEVPAWT